MIYWITRLDSIHGLCDGIQTISVISAIIGATIALISVWPCKEHGFGGCSGRDSCIACGGNDSGHGAGSC